MHNQVSEIGSQAQRALGLSFWCPCLNNFLTKGPAFSFCAGVLKIMGAVGPAKKSHSKVENNITSHGGFSVLDALIFPAVL